MNTYNIAEVLLEDMPAKKAIINTGVRGMDIIVGNLALSNFDSFVSDEDQREYKLKKALSKLTEYDYVLIDCTPSTSLININALVACNYYLVPLTPQYLSLEGLASLLKTVDQIKVSIGDIGELLGVLLTQVDIRNRATKAIIDILKSKYGEIVLSTQIKINTRIAEAPSFGKAVIQYDWGCSGSVNYTALTDEVISRLNQRSRVRT